MPKSSANELLPETAAAYICEDQQRPKIRIIRTNGYVFDVTDVFIGAGSRIKKWEKHFVEEFRKYLNQTQIVNAYI
jgi:hypothetical protein